MNDSLWQDEAQLANELLEGSTVSSIDSFKCPRTVDVKKNLTETFNKELSNVCVDNFEINGASPRDEIGIYSNKQISSNRPPLPVRNIIKRRKKGPIKRFAVYLRIRPAPSETTSSVSNGENNKKHKEIISTIEILKPTNKSGIESIPTTIRTYPPAFSNACKVFRASKDNPVYAKEFQFDQVLNKKSSQEYVYSSIAAPIIDDLFKASQQPSSPLSSKVLRESALLFSYGITNAGKTHTVLGDMNSTNQTNWGIIPRAISAVLERQKIHSISDSKGELSNLYISFFEIYNENVYDLTPSRKSISSKPSVNHSVPALKLRECRGQIFVRGLAEHKIGSLDDGFELAKLAHNRRRTSCNNLNSESSRSHFICQMQIISQSSQPNTQVPIQNHTSGNANEDNKLSSFDCANGYSTDEEAQIRSNKATSIIWIVDLAGSERSKRTRLGSTRQKESTKINNSLMTLMRCLNTMKDDGKLDNGSSKSAFSPFRESKLTHLFQGHLTSKSAARTAMIVNVNPSVEDFDETQHVLAYAKKAKLIKINPEKFSMKRKNHCSDEYEYDQNGRKKTKHQNVNSLTNIANQSTSIISRMVMKFSPKKVVENVPFNTKEKKKNFSNNNCKEIEGMRKSLQEYAVSLAKLEKENSQLLAKLGKCENEIRTECALEMEERLRETRSRHDKKYEYLRSVINSQTLKTDISALMERERTQSKEELIGKVDLYEKEMSKMKEKHTYELKELNTRLVIAANEKVENIAKIDELEKKLTYDTDVYVGMTKKSSKKNIDEEVSFFQKTSLRSRKPFGNFTNQV